MIRTLIIVNTAVFCMWAYTKATNNGKLFKSMREHTILSWYNIKANRYWTLVTSAFSHQNIMHILFNMMSLNAFGGVLCIARGVGIGPFHVAALFCGSAIAGSLAFLYQKKPRANKLWGPYAQHGLASSPGALGASGAVMGFATAATCIAPFMPMSFLLIPGQVPMFLMTGIYIGIDLFCIGQEDLIARSAHLGGAVFGAVYYLAFLRRFGGISHVLRHWALRR
jgi:membrane associated rhomboid family serine protease